MLQPRTRSKRFLRSILISATLMLPVATFGQDNTAANTAANATAGGAANGGAPAAATATPNTPAPAAPAAATPADNSATPAPAAPAAPADASGAAPAAPADSNGAAPAAPAAPGAPADNSSAPAAPADATATPAPESAAAAAPTPATPGTLIDNVKDFWHYGKVARYDLANISGQKILAANAEPVKVVEAFEQMLSEQQAYTQQQDNLDEWLLRWSNLPQMHDITSKLQGVLNQGYLSRKSEPAFIKKQIERLSVNERARAAAMNQLRQSGELAVPFMLDYLRDPSKTQYQAGIRVALRDLGKLALNPLVAATYMQQGDALTDVIGALGDIGYDSAIPYVARIAADKSLPDAVHQAANGALAHLNAVGHTNVAQAFYELAEKQYYGNSSISADTRNPMAYVWYFDASKGLYKIDVPQVIYNDIMTMRQTEQSLKAGGAQGNAMSLWLSANYKREANLPQGQHDMTRPENYPDANYWGVTAGAQYLNDSLSRALRDHNSTSAMHIINSLQQIVGQSNLFGPKATSGPLINAMAYPDRLVRFEAAFAVANSLPQTKFSGQERVVPLLAEALAQTGQGSAVLVMPSQDQANTMVDALKKSGLNVVGVTTAESAVTNANSMASIDVLVASDDLPAAEIDRLFQLSASNPKLQGAAHLVMVKTDASPYVQRAINDKSLSTTRAADAAGLQAAITESMRKAGALPLTPDVASHYAMRAGVLLRWLALSRGQVLDIMAAKQNLLAAMNDPRPEIVKIAGQVLGLINDKDAQAALLLKASDAKTTDDVKVSIYNSLGSNAKFFGNMLSADQVQTLSKTVESAPNLQVRSAAAEARGALNLPADQAKNLIVGQAR